MNQFNNSGNPHNTPSSVGNAKAMGAGPRSGYAASLPSEIRQAEQNVRRN